MLHRPDLGYYDEGHDFTSATFYEASIAADVEPSVLPPAAFRSLTFTQLEDEAIWTRDWICVGAHEAIPGIGDLLPFTVGTHGLHVQRMETGLAARFNKAQHGGCRVVPLQCQTGAKTRCSFTSCGYSRDRAAIPAGELGDGTPQMHQYLGLRPERLLTAHVRSWGPLIFVNLDVRPPDIDDMLCRLNRAGAFFGNHKRIHRPEQWIELEANWKLLAQHLSAGTTVEEDAERGLLLARTVLSDGREARTAWLFPNLVFIATDTETCAVVLQPTAIDQTLCRVLVYGEGTNNDAFWQAEIAIRAASAEQEHVETARWATGSRPDTIGAPLPRQTHPQGIFLQRTLAGRVRRMSGQEIAMPLFQNPRM